MGRFFLKLMLCGVCSFFLLPTNSVDAALLYFDPGEVYVHRGDTVTVSLRIDTDEGECINAVDAVVHYDPSVRAVDVSRGDSILNVWVEPPKIDESTHTITFAGGLPGGYCGRIPGDPRLTNVVLELMFQSPGFNVGGGDNQSARIWVEENAQVLLHDGFGTNAPLRLQDARIQLLDEPGAIPSDSWNAEVSSDDQMPSDFSITLSRDETAFSGKYFITFNAIDKQSGIDHYEVMEEPIAEFDTFRWGGVDAPWVTTQSPYVLKDQSLNSTIRVKAIDKAGNERIVVLLPDPALQTMSRDEKITFSVFGGVALLLFILSLYAYRKRKQNLREKEVTLQDTYE